MILNLWYDNICFMLNPEYRVRSCTRSQYQRAILNDKSESHFDKRFVIVDLAQTKESCKQGKNRGNVYFAKANKYSTQDIPINRINSFYVEANNSQPLYDFLDELIDLKPEAIKIIGIIVATNNENKSQVQENFTKEGTEILDFQQIDLAFRDVPFAEPKPNEDVCHRFTKAVHIARNRLLQESLAKV